MKSECKYDAGLLLSSRPGISAYLNRNPSHHMLLSWRGSLLLTNRLAATSVHSPNITTTVTTQISSSKDIL